MDKEDQIIALLEEIVDRNRLEQRASLGNFLNWAYKQGRAYRDVASLNATIPDSTTVALTVNNPAGYIWIPHYEVIWTETENVVSMKLERDGQTFVDTMLLPTKVEFNWTQIIPWFAFGVIKSTSTTTITNTSLADKWLTFGYIATYVRVEDYNEFIDDVNLSYPREWRKYGKG